MDLVVTVPQDLWVAWIAEGDAAGEPESGEQWGFMLGLARPPIVTGERLYIVACGLLRGYAIVTRVAFVTRAGQLLDERPAGVDGRWGIVRRGGAVACTIDENIRGFQSFRRRWWEYSDEVAFPDWKTKNVPARRPRPKREVADYDIQTRRGSWSPR